MYVASSREIFPISVSREHGSPFRCNAIALPISLVVHDAQSRTHSDDLIALINIFICSSLRPFRVAIFYPEIIKREWSATWLLPSKGTLGDTLPGFAFFLIRFLLSDVTLPWLLALANANITTLYINNLTRSSSLACYCAQSRSYKFYKPAYWSTTRRANYANQIISVWTITLFEPAASSRLLYTVSVGRVCTTKTTQSEMI